MKIYRITDFISHNSEFYKILKFTPSISEDGPWVAGGSVWKSIEGISLTTCDVDFFFQSAKQYEDWYGQILSIPYVHRIVSETKINQYNTSFKYYINDGSYNKTITIQLISFKFFKSMEDLLNSFDFTACQFGYDGRQLYTGETSIDDVKNRNIIFHNIANPFSTITHLKKYKDLGFKVSDEQAKILNDKALKDSSKSDSEYPIDESITERPVDEYICANIVRGIGGIDTQVSTT